ncbi:hypothetical protein MAA8898_00063 [Maliponia aquimaris]|uniref:Uncharacterized protein n=1 Tax=Maliponia aquimaris TaxID=1673631 RepID=A0A238JMG3_9RHOB|nr:hypothetical protein MAA8898_00063 [Maliponia aquimaris]
MTTPDTPRREIRRMLDRATPDPLRRLLEDSKNSRDDGRTAT